MLVDMTRETLRGMSHWNGDNSLSDATRSPGHSPISASTMPQSHAARTWATFSGLVRSFLIGDLYLLSDPCHCPLTAGPMTLRSLGVDPKWGDAPDATLRETRRRAWRRDGHLRSAEGVLPLTELPEASRQRNSSATRPRRVMLKNYMSVLACCKMAEVYQSHSPREISSPVYSELQTCLPSANISPLPGPLARNKRGTRRL